MLIDSKRKMKDTVHDLFFLFKSFIVSFILLTPFKI